LHERIAEDAVNNIFKNLPDLASVANPCRAADSTWQAIAVPEEQPPHAASSGSVETVLQGVRARVAATNVMDLPTRTPSASLAQFAKTRDAIEAIVGIIGASGAREDLLALRPAAWHIFFMIRCWNLSDSRQTAGNEASQRLWTASA